MDKKVDDNMLGSLSGGVLIEDNVAAYMCFIPLAKRIGMSRDEFLAVAQQEWEADPGKFSTNRSEEDFHQFMDSLRQIFDTYQLPE